MSLILILSISASVFSLEGLGQEQAVFQTPFMGLKNLARIEFYLKPEFNLLNKGKDFRGLFWTNPFYLSMEIPVYQEMVFSFGWRERFNQVFDIYGETGELNIYVQGRGGIEEVYCQLNQRLNFAEFFFRGSYLYGNSREIWRFTIDDYSVADTFYYKNKGQIFCAGLKIFMVSGFLEGLGKLDVEKAGIDTTYNLPKVLNLKLKHKFSDWTFSLIFEHSFWNDNNKVNRFKGMLEGKNFGFSYAYNPWYINNVQEHLLWIFLNVHLTNFATISVNPEMGVRLKGSLREFVFSPGMRLALEEIFARRKK
ncbi:MAG: hypothetical protein ACUVUH_09585 [bacterium]